MMNEAYKTFKSISSQCVVNEVVGSQQGRQYLVGIVEIYKVVRRITASMKAFCKCEFIGGSYESAISRTLGPAYNGFRLQRAPSDNEQISLHKFH